MEDTGRIRNCIGIFRRCLWLDHRASSVICTKASNLIAPFRVISWPNWAFIFLLLFALNGLDYVNLGDVFRQGKIRYLFLSLIPPLFIFLKNRLTWGPAFFFSLALFSFVIHDYMIFAEFPFLLILAVFAAACFMMDLSENVIARIFVLSGVFQAVLALLQVCGIYFIFRVADPNAFRIPVGFMGHESVLGSFLAATICPALWRKNYLSAGVMAIAILATGSAMSCASLGAVLVIFWWHKFSFRAAAQVCAAGLAAMGAWFMLRPGDPFLSFHGRMFIWPFGLRAIADHPLFGSGIGSWVGIYVPIFKDEILKQFNHHVPYQLHNDYLDFLVEYGKAAFAVLSVALLQFIYRFKPTWTHATCASILVASLGNFPLCLPPTALIFLVCWAHSNRNVTI